MLSRSVTDKNCAVTKVHCSLLGVEIQLLVTDQDPQTERQLKKLISVFSMAETVLAI